ncbi:hypothetical protein ACFX12_041316 [Malus domestica]
MNVCANKAVKEVAKIMAAEAYSSVEEIKRSDSELVALKWSNIYAPASLQLETARHEIVDLKTRLDAIQVKYETGGEAPDDAVAKSVTAVEVEDNLFGCFGSPIALRISRPGHMLLYAIFFEELHQIFAHELRAIVGDDGLRDAKSVNDVPPYEALYVHLNRGRHGLYFYLFGEVVSCHDHHAFAPSSLAVRCAVDMQMPEISIEGVGAAKVCLTAFGASLGCSVALSRLGVKARQGAVELGLCYM